MNSKEKPVKNTFWQEFFSLTSLILLYTILCFIFVGHLGNIFIDVGREAYLPEKILQGGLLYRDVFVLFGPLSYQINSFLYKVLGTDLSVLYLAGAANSFVILIVYYLIARKLTSRSVSWLACLALMVTSVFNFGISNYIFPYSYAMVYALCAFLIAVLFCLYYFDSAKPLFLILSALFMGASITSKVDFMLFSIVLIAIGVYFRPLKPQYLLIFILSFFIIPFLSYGSLFLSGLKLTEFLHYLETMKKFVSSEYFTYFYQNFTGLYPTTNNLLALVKTIKTFFINFSINFAIFYAFYWIFHKIPEFKFKKPLQIISFIILYLLLPKAYFRQISTFLSYTWLPISTALILLICHKDKKFLIVSIAGILTSLKSFFFININIFGAYLIPLALLINLIFLFDKIPGILRFIPQKPWRQSGFTVIIIMCIAFLIINVESSRGYNNFQLKTFKGNILVTNKDKTAIKNLITYIQNNIPKNKTFVMMPDGLMINFLTNHTADGWYHTFTPHFIDVYGESNIIENLKRKQPDYIFITNQDTSDYNAPFFCKDYAENICSFIFENYAYVKRIDKGKPDSKELYVDIFKIKY